MNFYPLMTKPKLRELGTRKLRKRDVAVLVAAGDVVEELRMIDRSRVRPRSNRKRSMTTNRWTRMTMDLDRG